MGESGLSAHGKQAMSDGMDRQGDPVGGTDLAQQLSDMSLDCPLGQAKFFGDVLVGAAHRQKPQDLALPAADHLAIMRLHLARSSGCGRAFDKSSQAPFSGPTPTPYVPSEWLS